MDADTKLQTIIQHCTNENMSTDGVFDLVRRGLIERFHYGNRGNNVNRGNNRNKEVGRGHNITIHSATTLLIVNQTSKCKRVHPHH